MFDNIQEPKDILAEVDASEHSAQKLSPPPQPPIAPQELPPVLPISNSHSRKGLFLLIAFILFALVGMIIVYIFWSSLSRSVPEPSSSVSVSPSASASPTSPVSSSPEPTAAAPISQIDSDGDGLLDAEELEVGTNIRRPDTDDDGLGDREEIKVYLTDPLVADTDGDSYTDGSEVKNGYNPLGMGKLLQLPN